MRAQRLLKNVHRVLRTVHCEHAKARTGSVEKGDEGGTVSAPGVEEQRKRRICITRVRIVIVYYAALPAPDLCGRRKQRNELGKLSDKIPLRLVETTRYMFSMKLVPRAGTRSASGRRCAR